MTDRAIDAAGICECFGWADIDARYRVLTGHHPNCAKGPNGLESAYSLIRSLVDGITGWAADEDGVPDDLWPSYRKAYFVAHGILIEEVPNE